MRITLLFTGKTRKDFIEQGIDLYSGRLRHYVLFKIIEVTGPKQSGKINESVVREKEAEQIMKHISPDDYVVILDQRGRMMSSEELAGFIGSGPVSSVRQLVFVIGGAFGLGKKVYDRADDTLSLSKMTFSNQLTRIIFLEQLYRAFTIIRGEPYHHG